MTLVVPSGRDGTILIAVDDHLTPLPLETGTADGSLASASPAEVLDKLAEVGDRIANVCKTVYEKATTQLGDVAPDELTLEFGITLGGSAGVPFVAKGKADGTFKVTAKWTQG